MSSTQTIRFCENCQNKLYHRVSEESLEYFCRVCGANEPIVNEGVCVLNIQYNDKHSSIPPEHFINKYTKFDPTLPHIVLTCPNGKCESNKKENKKSDVIYIRYDDNHMKHLYLCTICDYIWKSND